MKNGVLSALFVFVSIAGMQQQEQERASALLPGEVCDTNEDVNRALDSQVANCIAELIQCSVEYDIFSRGTDDEAANLFFCKEKEIDPRHLLNSDIRSVGKSQTKIRKRAYEADLLRAFARGGTCKKLSLYTSLVEKEEPLDRDAREKIDRERAFYNKDLPRLLGICDTRLLQQLIKSDDQIRACLTVENLPFNNQLLFGVVTKRNFNAQDAADSLYVLCQAGCKAAQDFVVMNEGCNESVAQNSSRLCARTLRELDIAACHVAKPERGSPIITEFLEQLESPSMPKPTDFSIHDFDCQGRKRLTNVFSKETTEGEPSPVSSVESDEKHEQESPASIVSRETTERVLSPVLSASSEEKPVKSLRGYFCHCSCL